MSDIFQNRSEEELKIIIDRFKQTLKFQYYVVINNDQIVDVAADIIDDKMNELVKSRMNDFSIPELFKIMELCSKKEEIKPEKINNNKKSNRSKNDLQ